MEGCLKPKIIQRDSISKRHQIKLQTKRGWEGGLPGVLTEGRDKVALLVFRIQEEDGPVQETLLVLVDLSPRDLLGAEAVQTEL